MASQSNLLHVSPIKEMELRAAKVPGVVSLAQGIPDFDTPDCIKNRAIEAIQEGRVARYSLTPGILELREVIEYNLAKENIFYDFEKEIIVTCGSIEAITATFLAFLEPGDEVIVPDPTYTSYQSAIKTARAKPVFAPLDESQNWAFDIANFRKKITPRTRAILFCNPNNPTGTLYSRAQLLQLMELAEKHDLLILSDEVYKDFLFEQAEFTTLAQFSAFRKRLIYIFSFSKTYAMTGWRIAFLAADKSLTEKIIGIHDALVTCAPVVSQWAALGALELAQEDKLAFRAAFDRRRKLICREFEPLQDWLKFVNPQAAYFIFPRATDKLKQAFEKWEKKNQEKLKEWDLRPEQTQSFSWKLALALLYEAKIALVPGVAFGPQGENHLRLCFGRSERDIKLTARRIKGFLEKL